MYITAIYIKFLMSFLLITSQTTNVLNLKFLFIPYLGKALGSVECWAFLKPPASTQVYFPFGKELQNWVYYAYFVPSRKTSEIDYFQKCNILFY